MMSCFGIHMGNSWQYSDRFMDPDNTQMYTRSSRQAAKAASAYVMKVRGYGSWKQLKKFGWKSSDLPDWFLLTSGRHLSCYLAGCPTITHVELQKWKSQGNWAPSISEWTHGACDFFCSWFHVVIMSSRVALQPTPYLQYKTALFLQGQSQMFYKQAVCTFQMSYFCNSSTW